MSIQELIENAVFQVFKERIAIIGCGRTDAQVHAAQFFFHIDLEENPGFDVVERLNYLLPPEIALYDLIPVDERANARYDAVSRTYDYFWHTDKNPFLAQSSAYFPGVSFDLERIKTAVDLLPRYEDYYAFCKQPDKHPHTLCRVQAAQLWRDPSGTRFRFQITANRFLKGMIRILMTRLMELGTGRIDLATFEAGLQAPFQRHRVRAAAPQGLYLSSVIYPYLHLPTRPFGGTVEWLQV